MSHHAVNNNVGCICLPVRVRVRVRVVFAREGLRADTRATLRTRARVEFCHSYRSPLLSLSSTRSVRLMAFESKCHLDAKLDTCTGSAQQCRAAMLGIMGTVLMINCTCSAADARCRESRAAMLGVNRCTGDMVMYSYASLIRISNLDESSSNL